MTEKVKVLLIDDDEEEFMLVKKMLHDRTPFFDLHWSDTLGKGMDYLSQNAADVVLLDLFLTDSRGFETFDHFRSRFNTVPVVIMSSMNDEQSAVEAVQKGAQDYLVKGHADSDRLARVLQYAVKRHDIRKELRTASLTDPLTKLYNRHGFTVMAEQQLKLAKRTHKGFFICFSILNDLSEISERYGQEEGQHALITAAEILRESFRPSDIVARIDHDGFAILTAEQQNYSPSIISERIRKNQKYHNAQFNRYQLSLSMYVNAVDVANAQSIHDLLARTDETFRNYRKKQSAEESIPT